MTAKQKGSLRCPITAYTEITLSFTFPCFTVSALMDRSRWRKQIGIFDDHDECEWENVSSGTGSPGVSQKKFKEL